MGQRSKRPRDVVVATQEPPTETTTAVAPPNKRARLDTTSKPHTSPPTPLAHGLDALLDELNPKYNIKPASIISSSKIENKVEAILKHLGQFEFKDLSVLPGIIMVHARANDSNKLVTVVEIVKRRMGEMHQPWYQYNGVYEMKPPAKSAQQRGQGVDETVIEETVLGGEQVEDDFEKMEDFLAKAAQEKFERERMLTCMVIFLSRVPVPELLAKQWTTLQTNAVEIAKWRKEQHSNA